MSLFTCLRTHWDLLPHSSSQAVTFKPVNYTYDAKILLSAMRGDTIACAEEVVEFVRDDYHELTDMSLIFLGHTKNEVNIHRTRCTPRGSMDGQSDLQPQNCNG
jgi:hypothetical protein